MAYKGYKVFANHAHVFEDAVRPHGSIDRLKALMEEVGIDKVVAFAPICGGPTAIKTSGSPTPFAMQPISSALAPSTLQKATCAARRNRLPNWVCAALRFTRRIRLSK